VILQRRASAGLEPPWLRVFPSTPRVLHNGDTRRPPASPTDTP
jgi:hypothetical protein